MRVVWKDSRTYKTYTYRGYTIEKCPGGWSTSVPGDEFIYYSAETAHNAVDEMLGGHGNKINAGRRAMGVKIVGKKGGDGSCA